MALGSRTKDKTTMWYQIVFKTIITSNSGSLSFQRYLNRGEWLTSLGVHGLRPMQWNETERFDISHPNILPTEYNVRKASGNKLFRTDLPSKDTEIFPCHRQWQLLTFVSCRWWTSYCTVHKIDFANSIIAPSSYNTIFQSHWLSHVWCPYTHEWRWQQRKIIIYNQNFPNFQHNLCRFRMLRNFLLRLQQHSTIIISSFVLNKINTHLNSLFMRCQIGSAKVAL